VTIKLLLEFAKNPVLHDRTKHVEKGEDWPWHCKCLVGSIMQPNSRYPD